MKSFRMILLASAGLAIGFGAAQAQEQTSAAVQPAAAEAAKPMPAGTPVLLDHIAIRVGNEIVTDTEIEEPLRQLHERLSQQFRGEELEKKMKQARQEHQKRLVEDKLLLLEARAENIEVTDAQVDERLKQEMNSLRAQFPTEQEFQKQLATEHLTVDDLREQRRGLIKDQLLRQRLLQGKLQEFTTGADVSEAQLSAYYEQHRNEFRRPPRVYLNQIFVARPDPGLSASAFAKQDNQARAKIDRALAALKNGKDFEAVAREYSEHRITAEKGGEVGWISQGDTGMPDFDKEVFETLKAGDTSQVISTGRGYFIVRINDRQEGGQTPLEEVRGRIRQLLMSQGSDARYQAWLETLKGKFKVVTSEK